MKKKLKVLVLFDCTSPTTVDQDFTKELKTKDWKTEADVMARSVQSVTQPSILPFMTMSISCAETGDVRS